MEPSDRGVQGWGMQVGPCQGVPSEVQVGRVPPARLVRLGRDSGTAATANQQWESSIYDNEFYA